MEDVPDFSDPNAARAVAEAINVVTADILKNTPRVYPMGHPVDDLPRVANDIERALKLGRLEDAKKRAGLAEKYLEVYAPSEEGAVAAKSVLVNRIHSLSRAG
jgi:hypothetical protein